MIRQPIVPLLLMSSIVHGATLTVNSTADVVDATPGDGVCETAAGNNVCTLRAAIQETNALGGTNTVHLPEGTYTLAIVGHDEIAAVGDLDVLSNLTLLGAGASTTIVDGGGATINDHSFDLGVGESGLSIHISGMTIRNSNDSGIYTRGNNQYALDQMVFTQNNVGVFNDGNVTITHTTFANNAATSSGGGSGGGVDNNASAAVMTISDSTFSENTAVFSGGAVSQEGGTLTMTNCTLSGNSASQGGGIASYQGTATLNNITVAGNSATTAAGGVRVYIGSSFSVSNSIIAGNSSTADPDCLSGGTADLISLGYNLIQDVTGCVISGTTTGDILGMDPLLGPLANNGGTTQTRALLPGSPALDKGNPASPGSTLAACAAMDQVGTSRPEGSGCDIGAYERPAAPPDMSTPELDAGQPIDLAQTTSPDGGGGALDLAVGAPDLAPGMASSPSGCSCRVGAGDPSLAGAAALALVLLALALRRRSAC